MIATETPRRRALEALETLGIEFGVSHRAVERADDWQPLAVAMLAEGLAALLIEVKPKTGPTSPRWRRGA
jgi:hypothetical protein